VIPWAHVAIIFLVGVAVFCLLLAAVLYLFRRIECMFEDGGIAKKRESLEFLRRIIKHSEVLYAGHVAELTSLKEQAKKMEQEIDKTS
jgi:hypothetical protein